jgi:hypothetical protein
MHSVYDVLLAISTTWAPVDTEQLSYVFDCPPAQAEDQMVQFLDFPRVDVTPGYGYVSRPVEGAEQDVWYTRGWDGTPLWVRVPAGQTPDYLSEP